MSKVIRIYLNHLASLLMQQTRTIIGLQEKLIAPPNQNIIIRFWLDIEQPSQSSPQFPLSIQFSLSVNYLLRKLKCVAVRLLVSCLVVRIDG